METREYTVVNSFAEKSFGGNPAGVFINAEGLDRAAMQSMARQMNLVESVFVFPSAEKEYDFYFRYFTPQKELPIAGHPTIAAVLALMENKAIEAEKRTAYAIKTNAGIKRINITGSESGPVVTMEQQKPVFYEILGDRKKAAEILALEEGDLMEDLPVQPVDTGLGHIIVAVKSLEALMRVQRKTGPLKKLCEDSGVMEAQVFTFETYGSDKTLHTRNICPREGIEDPACGVGNGALAAYLLKHFCRHEDRITVRAEQGDIVGMPSVVEATALRKEDGIEVWVGGRGKVMRKGIFFLD